MRQQSIKLLSLLLVLFALSAATANPTAQADVVGAKSTVSTSDEISTLTLDPALLVGLENRAPSAPLASFGPSLPKETEPNGTPAEANFIVGDAAVVEGNIYPNADVDYYAFTAQAGDKLYAATMTSFSANGNFDSNLRLFDTDGTTLIEFDNSDGTFGAASSSIAGATLVSGGTYYLEVRHNLATAQLRPYYLYFRLQRGTPTPEVEPNNTPATANALPPNGWVSGTVSPADDDDMYAFSANAGDTVFLSLDIDPERDNVQWNGRLGLALFGNANDTILIANDGSTGSVANPLSEAFFMTVKDAGTYYAFVDHPTAGSGDPTFTYQLSVTIFPAVDEGVNCTTYTSTDVPQVIPTGPGMVSSTLTVPGNPRIADIDVFITLDHTFMQDLDVHLRSPAGNDNGIFTDIGAGTLGGPQTQMELILDDEAAIPPSFALTRPFVIKPELAYRLAWFDGIDAGGTWTLDIRDDVAGDGGNLTAWGIRICEPEPLLACPVGTVATTVYSSDFESDDGGFTHSGTLDEWERGLPATVATAGIAAFNTCHSGVNCWKTDLDGTYEASSNQNLLSPAIDLSGLVGPVYLTWAQRYQIESASFDHAWVDVQQVGGGSPTRLWEWLDATMTNTPGNPIVNIGASAGWGVYTRDISSYLGQNIEVLFHLDSDNAVQLGGLAIDDVAVTACMSVPEIELTKTVGTDHTTCASTDSLTLPATGGEVTYCYTVENTGSITLTNHTLVDDQLGTILNNFAYDLAPSASVFITETVLITQTTVNSATWTADNGSQTAVASATATVTVPIANPSIILTQTVGLDPTVCANTNAITLPYGGGDVTFCFTVENTGDITLTHHYVAENLLGVVLNNVPYDLAPNATTFVTGTVHISQTYTSGSVWQAFIDGSPVPILAYDEGFANVTVEPHVIGVQLSADDAQNGLVGNVVTYTVGITNTGNASNSFLLEVLSGDWDTSLMTTTVILDAGDSTTFEVYVTVPVTAVDGDMDTAVIQATAAMGRRFPWGGSVDTVSLTTTAVSNALYGVQLSADEAQSGAVGSVITYTVHITNTGNVADTFDVSASAVWNTTPSVNSITLNAGAMGSFTVAVAIPANAADNDSDTATITATSQTDGTTTDSTDLTTTAVENPTYGVQLSADDAQSGDAGTIVTYTIHITNTGDVQDTFNLNVASVWTATPSTASITLGAGASAQFTVVVSIPANATNGQNDVATVTATSQTDGTATDTAQLTTTAVTPTPSNPTIYLPLIVR